MGGGVRIPVWGARDVADITREEGQEAVEESNIGKALGLNSVTAECFVRGGVR